MEMILANRLSIGYRQGGRGIKTVQRELDFSLKRGELTCLLGPNGAGKSTLLRTLSGMQAPLGGELWLDKGPLTGYSPRELSQLIGLVLTDKTQAGGLRVRELVALGRHPYVGFFGRLHREDHAVVERALEEAGITAKADSYMAELSDGERQKVMIAKALAQECPLILLDEPTAFLDVTSRIEIMHLLHRLARSGKTVLVSTHDIEQALALADRLWLLSREHGMRCGLTEDLVLEGAMERFFGRGEIGFDLRDGSFRLEAGALRPLAVEAAPEMARWVENLLARHGFRAVPAESGEALLRVHAPGQIEWHAPDGSRRDCRNFEELSDQLKKTGGKNN